VRSLLNAPLCASYRRSYYGSTYFFTVVTFHRQPILTAEAVRNVLHTAWVDVQFVGWVEGSSFIATLF
jgi:hypothetical protein